MDFIVDRPNNRVEFKLGDDREPFRTPGYAAALRRDRAYADAEARRMLYVAATRARDWLILPSFPADSLSRRDSFHTYLDEAAPHWLTRDGDPDTVVLSPRTFDAAPSPQPVLRLPPYGELRDRWRERHDAALEGGTRSIATVTPSRLGQSSGEATVDVGVDESERAPDDSSIRWTSAGRCTRRLRWPISAISRSPGGGRRRICRRHHVPEAAVLVHIERWRCNRICSDELLGRRLFIGSYR